MNILSLNAKAIAAFLATLIIQALAPIGVTGSSTLEEVLFLVITALITAVTVWLVPNKQ